MTTWPQALDAYEQALNEYGELLTGAADDVPSIWAELDPPAVPLPEEHADRARSLLERSELLRGQIEARLDERPTAPALDRRRADRRPSILDVSA